MFHSATGHGDDEPLVCPNKSKKLGKPHNIDIHIYIYIYIYIYVHVYIYIYTYIYIYDTLVWVCSEPGKNRTDLSNGIGLASTHWGRSLSPCVFLFFRSRSHVESGLKRSGTEVLDVFADKWRLLEKMGVPKNGCFRMESPIQMDDLGVIPPILRNLKIPTGYRWKGS